MAAIGVLAMLIAMPLPGVNVVQAFAGLLLVSAGALLAYTLTGARTRTGEVILTASALLLSVGVVLNVWWFTAHSGGTDSSPVLLNVDAARYWNDALARLGRGGELAQASHSFYGAVVAGVISCFGQSIMAVLIFQMAQTLAALVLCAAVCRRLGLDSWTATLAMGACAAVCYFLVSGTLLTKDPWVFVTMGASGMALSGRRLNVLWLALAAVMAVAVRSGCLLMFVVGLYVTVFRMPRGQRQWVLRSIAAAILVALFMIPELTQYAPSIASRLSITESVHEVHPQQYAYYGLVGDYYQLPLMRRILLLPFTAVTQFLIPFPWNFWRDTVFGITEVYAHISYPWYFFGALLVYFLATARRCASRSVLPYVLWGVVCWLVPCFLDGGTISRYGLPAVPLMAPGVGVVIARHRHHRPLKIWLMVFVILLVITLIVCYRLHTAGVAGPNPLEAVVAP